MAKLIHVINLMIYVSALATGNANASQSPLYEAAVATEQLKPTYLAIYKQQVDSYYLFKFADYIETFNALSQKISRLANEANDVAKKANSKFNHAFETGLDFHASLEASDALFLVREKISELNFAKTQLIEFQNAWKNRCSAEAVDSTEKSMEPLGMFPELGLDLTNRAEFKFNYPFTIGVSVSASIENDPKYTPNLQVVASQNAAIGGAIGAIGGKYAGAAIGGILGGPAGALVGAFVGSIVGSLIGSLSVIIFESIFEFASQKEKYFNDYKRIIGNIDSAKAALTGSYKTTIQNSCNETLVDNVGKDAEGNEKINLTKQSQKLFAEFDEPVVQQLSLFLKNLEAEFVAAQDIYIYSLKKLTKEFYLDFSKKYLSALEIYGKKLSGFTENTVDAISSDITPVLQEIQNAELPVKNFREQELLDHLLEIDARVNPLQENFFEREPRPTLWRQWLDFSPTLELSRGAQ